MDEETKALIQKLTDAQGGRVPDRKTQDAIAQIVKLRKEGKDVFGRTWKAKTREIFSFAGERAKNLDGAGMAVRERVASVYEKKLGTEKAYELAYHVCDWNDEAAFIVALHLYPERFTNKEIASGIEAVLIHAPNHLLAAATLAGKQLIDIWDLGIEVAGPNA
jgi:hypothetical protein